jgi:hypothetical protein
MFMRMAWTMFSGWMVRPSSVIPNPPKRRRKGRSGPGSSSRNSGLDRLKAPLPIFTMASALRVLPSGFTKLTSTKIRLSSSRNGTVATWDSARVRLGDCSAALMSGIGGV